MDNKYNIDEELDFSYFDDSIHTITEQISVFLKSGTRFERDVRYITNQTTFRLYLDKSGVSDSIKEQLYKQINRMKPIADSFTDKSFFWKALYLGAVYKALSDHQTLDNIIR
jgi:hypothetical protein